MTLFQTLGVAFVVLLLLSTVTALSRRRITLRPALLWSLICLAAGVVILRPDITVRIAHLMGIGRGVDLVLYVSILSMLVGFFFIYLRFRRVEEQITRLVREIALRDAPVRRNDGTEESTGRG